MTIFILIFVAVILYGGWLLIHSEIRDNVKEATLVDYWSTTAFAIKTYTKFGNTSRYETETEVVFELQDGKEIHLRSEKTYFEDMLNKKGTLTYRNGKLKKFEPYEY